MRGLATPIGLTWHCLGPARPFASQRGVRAEPERARKFACYMWEGYRQVRMLYVGRLQTAHGTSLHEEVDTHHKYLHSPSLACRVFLIKKP